MSDPILIPFSTPLADFTQSAPQVDVFINRSSYLVGARTTDPIPVILAAEFISRLAWMKNWQKSGSWKMVRLVSCLLVEL